MSHVSHMVPLIRQTWQLVEPEAEEVARYFYGMLFSIAPGTRELFPVNMETQRSRLLRALVHVIQKVDEPEELEPFLQQLGRDHRKFGVMTEHYEAVGTALLAAVREHAGEAWTSEVEYAWAHAYTIMAMHMTRAAAADTSPPFYEARIVEHHRLSWDLAIVRVQVTQPIPYLAGQYLSVEIPQRPRLWRYLTPAMAPSPDGGIEFHVRAVEHGWVSRAIVRHASVGDRWRIGSPMGMLAVDRQRDEQVLMLAGGTGVAPMRALIDELARYGENPAVTLYYGAKTAADLYDLANLNFIASHNPWLHVIPVVEAADEVDELTAQGVEPRIGTLPEAVLRDGTWQRHKILVSGSPEMTRATLSTLMASGIPAGHLHYDPFTLD